MARGVKGSPAACLALGTALLSPVAVAAVNPLLPSGVDECDRLVAEQPATLLSYQCYYHAARILGQQDSVRRHLEAILAREPANPWARFALGGVEFLRHSPAAERHYRDAADGLARFGDARGEVWVRLLLSQALANHGDTTAAGEEVRHAARVAAAAGGDRLPWTVWVRVNEAWQAVREANYLLAETILLRSEPVVFPRGNPYLQSSWLDVMATFAAATDRPREAAGLFARQADVMRGVEDRFEESAALFDEGLVTLSLAEQGEVDPAAAAALFERAAAVGVVGGNHGARSGALIELGRLSHAPAERRRLYGEGIALARAAGTTFSLRRGLALLGASLLGQAPVDVAKGRACLAEAEALARGSGDLEGLADTDLERAAALWDRALAAGSAEQAEAVEASLTALRSVEVLRARQRGEVVRARTLGHWSQAYSRLAGQLLAQAAKGAGKPDATALAFEVMERRRARELLERVRGREPGGGSGAGRSAEREAALAGISDVQRQLRAPSLSGAERAALVAQLPRLEIEEATLRAAGDAQGAGADPVGGWTTALRDVQEALRPDEALLSFQVAKAGDLSGEFDGGSWLVAVTREQARAYPLPEARALERSTRLFLGLLQRREGSERQAAARLHRDLVQAALAELPVDVGSLIVVPDGPLHGVPLGALGPGPDGALLGDRFHLATVPSAAVWLRWRARTRPQVERAALVFADPGSAYGRPQASDGSGETLRSWALETGERLGPLPLARREARTIRRRLRPGAVVLVAGAASEHAFKQIDLSRFGLLHVAAHGVIDDANPDRAGLLLAADGDEDGILQVRELSDVHLDGQVVVLSSCRSAAGALLGGEGPMGLARAFLGSGAGSVVASLWPVRDADAYMFFGRFYGALSEGESVSAALARAQRERRASGAPAEAWAGFVVYGDGDAIPVADGRSASPWPAFGAAGLLGAAVAAGLSRRRSPAA